MINRMAIRTAVALMVMLVLMLAWPLTSGALTVIAGLVLFLLVLWVISYAEDGMEDVSDEPWRDDEPTLQEIWVRDLRRAERELRRTRPESELVKGTWRELSRS